MSLVLLAVGLLVTAAGFVTIGFGIPINAFSLGNTLIVAGTIAVSAGLILIGIAAVLGQLRRIAEALRGRGLAAESVVPRVVSGPAPMTAKEAAPAPVETRAPEPVQPEPRAPAPVASEPAPGPLDWLRAKPRTGGAGKTTMAPPAEPPMVDVPEEVPLSPRSPQRAPVSEPALDPRAWSPSRSAPTEPRPAPRVDMPLPRATPQPEPKKDDFNLVWPDRNAPAGEPAKRAEPAKDEAKAEAPPAPTIRPRDARVLTSAKPAAERGPAILKSGVIDGMPYTLYADGSIEAELPQGTVKFASVDALRAHLEKQG
jgi:hypothetical protein